MLLAGYAGMCPSDYPAVFLSPYPTHASISLLILQLVSDWLAARNVLLASYAGMCPSDYPALLSFALPHTFILIPPDSAARE